MKRLIFGLLIVLLYSFAVQGQGTTTTKEVIKVTTDITGTSVCVSGRLYYNATSLVNWERNNAGVCAAVTSGGTPGTVSSVSGTANQIGVVNPTTTPLLSFPANGIIANNVSPGLLSTATAAGTTTLTVASKGIQVFTGSTTQTIQLPVVTTLPQLGVGFIIFNDSSGALTVNSSGGQLVQTVAAGARVRVVCILLTGTTAASWDTLYLPASFGITNSAGANVVPKSNGTNLVASNISDGSQIILNAATFINGISAAGVDAGASNVNQTIIGDINSAGNNITLTVDDAALLVTINTSLTLTGGLTFGSNLIPSTAGAIALGGVNAPMVSAYIGNAANNSAQLTGTFTGNRVATLPDATGTVLLDSLFNLSKTITTGGTTGAQTINKYSGSVNFAAAATSLVVTNSLVSTSSVVTCTVATNDTTMKSVACVATAGSFTIFSNAAATSETRVNFRISN